MIDPIELLVNEYPENLQRVEGSHEGLLQMFKERADRALKIQGMKERIIKVKGNEWQTVLEDYDASDLRQMCNNISVDKTERAMIAAFGKNVQGIEGYEFRNYLDGTPFFPEIPADKIVPDQSAMLLIGQAKHKPSILLGIVYSELFVPSLKIFADIPPVKSNRIFGIFPKDGRPTFTQLEKVLPNNLYFQMRRSLAPILQRNIEEHTEEFSGEANLIQRVYHDFQEA